MLEKEEVIEQLKHQTLPTISSTDTFQILEGRKIQML